MKKTWIALIPAYQPTSLLLGLLKEVKRKGFQILLVDDGSGENFQMIFQQAAQYGTVLRHNENRGKGRAIKTGLSYLHSHFPPGYVVVTMDADGQHKVSDAERLCRIAQDQPERLILGSRKLKENVPLRSRFGNTITRLVYRISTGQKVHDTQTGLRAFSSQLVPELLNIHGERYEYEMNVLLECSSRKIPIKEEEIDTIYIDGNAGSHFDTLKDSCRIYKEILKFSASSLVSFLVDYGLYILMSLVTAGLGSLLSLTVSNIGARAVSAGVNYTMNRRLVFQSKAGVGKSALQYVLLSTAILMGNTLLLTLLADHLDINRYLAKLFTELFFFVVSWLVQRRLIFRKKQEVQVSNGK